MYYYSNIIYINNSKYEMSRKELRKKNKVLISYFKWPKLQYNKHWYKGDLKMICLS